MVQQDINPLCNDKEILGNRYLCQLKTLLCLSLLMKFLHHLLWVFLHCILRRAKHVAHGAALDGAALEEPADLVKLAIRTKMTR